MPKIDKEQDLSGAWMNLASYLSAKELVKLHAVNTSLRAVSYREVLGRLINIFYPFFSYDVSEFAGSRSIWSQHHVLKAWFNMQFHGKAYDDHYSLLGLALLTYDVEFINANFEHLSTASEPNIESEDHQAEYYAQHLILALKSHDDSVFDKVFHWIPEPLQVTVVQNQVRGWGSELRYPVIEALLRHGSPNSFDTVKAAVPQPLLDELFDRDIPFETRDGSSKLQARNMLSIHYHVVSTSCSNGYADISVISDPGDLYSLAVISEQPELIRQAFEDCNKPDGTAMLFDSMHLADMLHKAFECNNPEIFWVVLALFSQESKAALFVSEYFEELLALIAAKFSTDLFNRFINEMDDSLWQSVDEKKKLALYQALCAYGSFEVFQLMQAKLPFDLSKLNPEDYIKFVIGALASGKFAVVERAIRFAQIMQPKFSVDAINSYDLLIAALDRQSLSALYTAFHVCHRLGRPISRDDIERALVNTTCYWLQDLAYIENRAEKMRAAIQFLREAIKKIQPLKQDLIYAISSVYEYHSDRYVNQNFFGREVLLELLSVMKAEHKQVRLPGPMLRSSIFGGGAGGASCGGPDARYPDPDDDRYRCQYF